MRTERMTHLGRRFTFSAAQDLNVGTSGHALHKPIALGATKIESKISNFNSIR